MKGILNDYIELFNLKYSVLSLVLSVIVYVDYELVRRQAIYFFTNMLYFRNTFTK